MALQTQDPKAGLYRTLGRIAWVVTAAIIVLAAAALFSGRSFSLGVLGDNGPKFAVEEGLAPEVSQEQAEEAQEELREVAAEASADIEAVPEARIDASVDIGGRWVGSTGGTYDIVQVGSAATIVEMDGFGNITASGEGSIEGGTFFFEYITAAFTVGSGQLTLDATGTELSGSFSDDLGTRPAVLFR